MTDQDRAAQVWKGPCKCKKCGNVLHGIVLETARKEKWHCNTFAGPFKECTGELEPFDRRNPSQANYGQEQDREIERLTAECERLRKELRVLVGRERDILNARDVQQEGRKKAEAELADCRAVYAAHCTEAEKQIDELQAELSACKERVERLEEKLKVARNGNANAAQESIMAGRGTT